MQWLGHNAGKNGGIWFALTQGEMRLDVWFRGRCPRLRWMQPSRLDSPAVRCIRLAPSVQSLILQRFNVSTLQPSQLLLPFFVRDFALIHE
jgi:hypothetical protein